MLKVSKLADYAVMIMLKMAHNPHKLYSATELLAMTGLNLPTVRKVLKLLSLQDLLQAKRGADGGYVMTKSPLNTSLLEIIEAVDGALAFTECCESGFNGCSVLHCRMHRHWDVVNQKVRATLKGFTLENLIKQETNNNKAKEIKQYG